MACFLSGLGLAAALPAQFCPEVRYGDPVVADSITAPNQVKCYTLKNARKDEIVVLSLASGAHFAYLALKQGTTVVGTLTGSSLDTFVVPADGDCRIEVAARDMHSKNFYRFQIDRLSDPVNAERICYGWNMRGSLVTQSQFVLYRFGALANKSATLDLSSGAHFGAAVVYGPDGAVVCSAAGTQSVPCTFQLSGLHTIVVFARDLHSVNWFAVDIRCQTWPCECTAEWGNFGAGWPGTNNKVPSLTLDKLPRIGTTVTLDIGNSSGQTAPAVVMVGVEWLNQQTSFGGSLHLAPAAVIPVNLPASGFQVPIYLQNDPNWCGLGLIFQSVQSDAGATQGLAFSRGLRMLIGQ